MFRHAADMAAGLLREAMTALPACYKGI